MCACLTPSELQICARGAGAHARGGVHCRESAAAHSCWHQASWYLRGAALSSLLFSRQQTQKLSVPENAKGSEGADAVRAVSMDSAICDVRMDPCVVSQLRYQRFWCCLPCQDLPRLLGAANCFLTRQERPGLAQDELAAQLPLSTRAKQFGLRSD